MAIAGLVGAVISLMLSQTYSYVIPSHESRHLVAARDDLNLVKEQNERAQTERVQLVEKIHLLQDQLAGAEALARSQREEHSQQLSLLDGQLQPFIDLAAARFPGVARDDALGRLPAEIAAARTRIKELETRAAKAERGVSDVYDFYGNRRQSDSAGNETYTRADPKLLQNLIALHDAGRWRPLLAAAKSEINAMPAWLTPYMFAGLAYAHLGLRAEAIKMFEHVQRNAPGDPDYAEAGALLRELRE